jgi:hypothetical protein
VASARALRCTLILAISVHAPTQFTNRYAQIWQRGRRCSRAGAHFLQLLANVLVRLALLPRHFPALPQRAGRAVRSTCAAQRCKLLLMRRPV